MVRIIFISVLVFICTLSSQAQSFLTDKQIDGLLKNDKLVLNFPDSTLTIYVLSESKDIKADEEKYYFWYRAGEVKYNKGGFDGKLLTGPYKVFYSDLNLKVSGEFKDGLKINRWTTWYDNGEKNTVSHYKKGVLHGKYTRYSETGQVLNTAIYKKGKLKTASRSQLKKKARKEIRKAKKEKKQLEKEQQKINQQQAQKEIKTIKPSQPVKAKWWKLQWLKKNKTNSSAQAQTSVKKKHWWQFWKKKNNTAPAPSNTKVKEEKVPSDKKTKAQ